MLLFDWVSAAIYFPKCIHFSLNGGVCLLDLWKRKIFVTLNSSASCNRSILLHLDMWLMILSRHLWMVNMFQSKFKSIRWSFNLDSHEVISFPEHLSTGFWDDQRLIVGQIMWFERKSLSGVVNKLNTLKSRYILMANINIILTRLHNCTDAHWKTLIREWAGVGRRRRIGWCPPSCWRCRSNCYCDVDFDSDGGGDGDGGDDLKIKRGPACRRWGRECGWQWLWW